VLAGGDDIAASLVTFTAYLAGQPAVAVYDGSLFAWARDPDLLLKLGFGPDDGVSASYSKWPHLPPWKIRE